MKQLITILLLSITLSIFSQTVIEMGYVDDADIVLREVNTIDSADVVIYKTTEKFEAKQWDCMWKFKSWGISNFAIYIIRDNEVINTTDSLLTDSLLTDSLIYGKVFFTDDKGLRGYKAKNFHIDGIMVKTKKD